MLKRLSRWFPFLIQPEDPRYLAAKEERERAVRELKKAWSDVAARGLRNGNAIKPTDHPPE